MNDMEYQDNKDRHRLIEQVEASVVQATASSLETDQGELPRELAGDGNCYSEASPIYSTANITPYFVELVGCTCFFLLSLLVSKFDVHQRPIPFQVLSTGEYIRNLVYNETHNSEETVPSELLYVLAFFLPVTLQIALSLASGGGSRDVHATLCTYLLAFALRAYSTNSIKLYCGYLRPSFYDLCQPENDYQSCQNDGSGMRQSFPSGHASQAFCGLTLLTLFVHNRFGVPSILIRHSYHMDDSSRHMAHYSQQPTRHRLISMISLIPMGGALFIAASRVHDNRHFPADVVGGSILGAGIAFFSYSLWF